MTKKLEEHMHFLSCIRDLESSKNILEIIKKEEGKDAPLLEAAFKFALVEYSKPYKKSKAYKAKLSTFDTKYIPKHLFPLHERIIKARDQILAHSDVTVIDPQIESIYGNLAKITYNVVTGLEELPNLDKIIELIEATIVNINTSKEEETSRNQIFTNNQQ